MSKPPLTGLRVLEVAEGLAGPTCGVFLADLGAEVIKVEPPEGDRARAWAPPSLDDDGAIFVHVNRGKRGVAPDLATAEGKVGLDGLSAAADAVILHLAPADRAAIGIDWK